MMRLQKDWPLFQHKLTLSKQHYTFSEEEAPQQAANAHSRIPMGLRAPLGQPHLSSITARAPEEQSGLIGSRASRPILSIPAKDAAAALRHGGGGGGGGYQLLDVRPAWEREKAWVQNSLHVPVYAEDAQTDPLTLLKKWIHFGYIGLWTGQRFTALNPSFVSEVQRLVPRKGDGLLVACGEGLRSIVAVKKLGEAGYENLAWLAGGFNGAGEGDFSGVEGKTKLQYATVGGVSYFFLQLLLFLRVFGP